MHQGFHATSNIQSALVSKGIEINCSYCRSVFKDFQSAVHIDLKNESKVLVLYTGGTIGMVRNYQGVLVPEVALNGLNQYLKYYLIAKCHGGQHKKECYHA